MDKLGVFLCTGCGIGDGVDVDAVLEAANERGCTATLTFDRRLLTTDGFAEPHDDDGYPAGV